jgi:hypothetical protein
MVRVFGSYPRSTRRSATAAPGQSGSVAVPDHSGDGWPGCDLKQAGLICVERYRSPALLHITTQFPQVLFGRIMTDETRPRARPGIAIQGELFVSPFQPIVLTYVPMQQFAVPRPPCLPDMRSFDARSPRPQQLGCDQPLPLESRSSNPACLLLAPKTSARRCLQLASALRPLDGSRVGIPHSKQPHGENHAPNSQQHQGEDASLRTKTTASQP